MAFQFSETVTISEEALFQEVSGECVILDLASESYFGLDETGTRIWQLLVEYGDVQQVFNALVEEYDVEPEVLEKDLRELILELDKAGLVDVQESAG